MQNDKIKVAIIYDFDGTLTPNNMQEYSFIPDIGIDNGDFWREVKELANEQDMDETLAYMHLMLKKAGEKNQSITEESFKKHGEIITFFAGVETWFARINQYAESMNITLEHYIISSGLREMIKGSKIAAEFKYIFASGFFYNLDKIAQGPAVAANYTNKTQFLFRINKGILNYWNNKALNEYTKEEKRPIPFSNMIYIGDGETDVPCMKMVRYKGGVVVAVYGEDGVGGQSRREICEDLIKHGRADYIAPADYREGSDIDKIIKLSLQVLENSHALQQFKLGWVYD